MTVSKRCSSKKKSSRIQLGRPNGVIQCRVQAVGPERFAIVAVDCAKQRCRWMMCNFYGKVLVEPHTAECTSAGLQVMIELIRETANKIGVVEIIVAVEVTGVYHRPVVKACRDAQLETREVHPFVSRHFAAVAHPDRKTDDNDLEGIFQAAAAGFGLVKPDVPEIYQHLQLLARHRRNLIKQRSRLRTQIRDYLHQTMPGYADLFSMKKFFDATIGIPIARAYSSAADIRQAGVEGVVRFLRLNKIPFRQPTVEDIVMWSHNAAPAHSLANIRHDIWCRLDDLRRDMTKEVDETTRKMAQELVKTPYCLLLSLQGINVVLAAEFAGEAGPMENYPRANAITGRAGLFPQRYQSDQVDRKGPLARTGHRRLRAAMMRMAECLSKHHPKYRQTLARWLANGVAPIDAKCRIANRLARMVFQLVNGRQTYHRHTIPSDYVLKKLLEFHHEHESSAEIISQGLDAAMQWLPKHVYKFESQPLQVLASKRTRRVVPIGTILAPLLLRLLGTQPKSEVESIASEARS